MWYAFLTNNNKSTTGFEGLVCIRSNFQDISNYLRDEINEIAQENYFTETGDIKTMRKHLLKTHRATIWHIDADKPLDPKLIEEIKE